MWGAHLHIDYERELVPLFFQGAGYALGSELEGDATHYGQILTVKLAAQLGEQPYLLCIKGLAVGIETICNLDPSAVTTTDSFNGVFAHECCDVITNRPLANTELVR